MQIAVCYVKQQQVTRVVIVGGGIAGLGAAKRLIERGHHVTLLDALGRVGGVCHAVQVGQHRVDGGVSHFNRATSPELRALIAELGLRVTPVNKDACYQRMDGTVMWSTRQSSDVEVQRELLRFHDEAAEVLGDPRFVEWTAAQYLDYRGYGDVFRKLVFAPRAAGCFAMSAEDPELYPIRSLVQVWSAEGFVGPHTDDRVAVVGGMFLLIDALQRWLVERGCLVSTSTRVLGLRRRAGGVTVRAHTGDEEVSIDCEHVVLATDPSRLLDDPTGEELRMFTGFPRSITQVLVHQDTRFMPRDRSAWGAFNFYVDAPVRPSSTCWLNRLVGLPDDMPDVFVTLNPPLPPEGYALETFVHTEAHLGSTLQARVNAAQGHLGTWYCGGYLREPWLHESALVSGLRVANKLDLVARQVQAATGPQRVRPPRLKQGDPVFLLETPASRDLSQLAEIVVSKASGVTLRLAAPRLGKLSIQPGMRFFWAQVDEVRQVFRVFRADVRSFDTEKLEVQVSPPLLMDERTRRRALRVALRIVCQVGPHTGETVDLSAEGCRVQLPDSVVLGSEQEHPLRLFFPNQAAPLMARVSVIRSEPGSASLAFAAIDPAEQQTLEATILRLANRQYARADVSVPAKVVWHDADTEEEARIDSLGGGGAGFTAAPSPAMGGVLRFALPDRGQIQAPFVVVRHDTPGHFGVEFTSIGEEERSRVLAFIMFLNRYAVARD